MAFAALSSASQAEFKPGFRSKIVPGLVLAVVFVILPLVLRGMERSYLYQLANLSFIFVILSVSMNLITGSAGLLTLGHAAFYGIGAYTAALLSVNWNFPFLLTLPLSGIVSAFFGILVALPTMRLVFIYFAVATLAIGEIIYVILLNWVSFTRGPMGVDGVGPIDFFGVEVGSRLGIYYVVAVVAVISVYVIYRMTHSYYGNAMRSMREDDQCAEAMGIDVVRIKIQVFAVSTFFAGIAGALYAHTSGYISPDSFKFSESILILAMVVVGGLGSAPGCIIGALLLTLLPEATRWMGDFRQMVYGGVMFLSILVLPKGILGEVAVIDFLRRQLGASWTGVEKKVGWR